jgi:hypothetical protein
MQVIGICRFSYPAIGGFQVTHDSVEERMDYLYDPARMAERFLTFEAFTLASLRAQTDADFTFLIVTGDRMPAEMAARLERLVGDMPQAVIAPCAPGPHRKVMQQAINAVRVKSRAPSLQFRLDDDDAVGVDFVRSLRLQAERALPLLDGQRSLAIDFNQGHVAQPVRQGILAAPVQAAYWSPALAVMLPPRARLTVMNYSHHKLWKTMPTVTFPAPDMLVRGHSAHNDSRQKPAAKPAKLDLLDPAGEDHFRAAYGIDADRVRALFSAA